MTIARHAAVGPTDSVRPPPETPNPTKSAETAGVLMDPGRPIRDSVDRLRVFGFRSPDGIGSSIIFTARLPQAVILQCPYGRTRKLQTEPRQSLTAGSEPRTEVTARQCHDEPMLPANGPSSLYCQSVAAASLRWQSRFRQ